MMAAIEAKPDTAIRRKIATSWTVCRRHSRGEAFMSRWQARRERFRSVLSGTRCVYPGSVFDPISARIAEDLGFEVGMFAGSVASLTVLGAPDLIVLTLTEFAEQAHQPLHLARRPLPVVGGKREQREGPDPEVGRRFDQSPHRPGALPMPGRARPALTGRPAPVAVHDDAHVQTGR